MISDWRKTTIGAEATLQRGFDITVKDQTLGTIPVISSSGISSFHSHSAAKGPGVVIGRKGTLGKVTYVEGDYWPHDTTLWVKDFHGNWPKFVYFFFQSLDLSAWDVGSVNPTLNRNHIHPIEVLWPSLPEQKTIAQILSSLDDKIELNRRMNATLETMAQTLFRAWFVDFEPVKAKAAGLAPVGLDAATAALFPAEFEDSELGLIPKGWEVRSLDAIANFLNGLALQKYPAKEEEGLPVIKISQLRKGSADGGAKASSTIPSAYIVEDGDMLFSWSGSLEVTLWCGGYGALNQHLFKVTSNDFSQWFYYLWTLHHLPEFRDIAADKATTMGHIQRRHLTNAKVLVPATPLMEVMNKVFEPLLGRLLISLRESRTLAQIRDALLPRLISGQLRVVE